jgi:hypothetical protein
VASHGGRDSHPRTPASFISGFISFFVESFAENSAIAPKLLFVRVPQHCVAKNLYGHITIAEGLSERKSDADRVGLTGFGGARNACRPPGKGSSMSIDWD